MSKYTEEELERLTQEYYNSRVRVSSSDTPVETGSNQKKGVESHPLYVITFKFSSLFDYSDITLGQLAQFYDEAYYFDTRTVMGRVNGVAKEFRDFLRETTNLPGSYVFVNTYTGVAVANDPTNRYMTDSIAGDIGVYENGRMRIFDDHDHPLDDLIPIALFESKQSEETCESLLEKMQDTARTLSISKSGTCFIPVARFDDYFLQPYLGIQETTFDEKNAKSLQDRLKRAGSLIKYNIDKSEGRRFDYGN